MSLSQKQKPPRLAQHLFNWYCNDALKEEIAGDLEERFLDHIVMFGLAKAKRKYWLNVFKFFRWHSIKRRNVGHKSLNQIAMFRNYFKIGFRNALRHKGYSSINILGLVLGLSSFVLIMLYVQHHTQFDKFHENQYSIYRVHAEDIAITPNALLPLIVNNFPDEIATAVRGLNSPSRSFKLGEDAFTKDAYYVDKDFLEMLSFPVIHGKREGALTDQSSIVITRSESIRLFGRIDVMGETISLENKTHSITAVVEDVPANSSMKFDYIVPLHAMSWTKDEVWNNYSYFSLIQLTDGVDPVQFKSKFNVKVNEVNGFDIGEENFGLQPLGDIHLQQGQSLSYEMFSVTDGKYIYIFSAVAIFILIIGVINYINLATARSLERAKEVGIRKVTGAVRGELIMQFLGESLMFVLSALLLSFCLILLVLPAFNQLAGVELHIRQLLQLDSILFLIGLGLVVSLLAGIYPALALSHFQPSQVLKGNFGRSKKGNGLRKSLVVFQFVISAFLFTATIVIDQQFDFIMNKDLGMRKEQVLAFSLPSNVRSNFSSFKGELLSNPNILGVSVTNNNPLAVGATHAFRKDSQDEFMQLHYLSGDEDFTNVMEMELLAGVGFDEVMIPFDQDRPSFIFNETAVKKLGLKTETAVGEMVDVVGKKAPIQAVVKDFHFASLSQDISPIIIINDPKKFYRAMVKVSPSEVSASIDFIESKLKSVAPEALFNYRFQDDSFENMYAKTSRLKTIFQLFSNLAVVIACLGMLGLIAFTVQNRMKEVSVRKVLGASVLNILGMLSGDFLKLVAVALLIALPLSFYAMNEWLSTYAYRTELGVGLFVIVTLSAVALTFLTISYQTIRTARVNPASILRND